MDTVFVAGKYLSWGVLSISVTNLLVIIAMLVVFGLALVVPFPRERAAHHGARGAHHDAHRAGHDAPRDGEG